jgi:Rrf2 family cysteine metabolism transcriptional repressor
MYSLLTDLVNISVKFSKKSEYGLRALIELTKNYGHPITRQQIGQRQNVPVVFLEQILLRLKHAGLVASTRGVQGGYALIKLPSKVTLGHVIRILDGPLAPIGCVSKTAYQKCVDCPYAKKAHCPLQHVMGGVRNAIADILDNYSLEDFISGMNESRRSPAHRTTARR